MVRSLFYVLILLLLYFIIQFIFFPNPPKLLAKIPPVIQSILTTLQVKSPHSCKTPPNCGIHWVLLKPNN